MTFCRRIAAGDPAAMARFVWIDIFAVRQWPGNGADLDFRGVIERTVATTVAVAPVRPRLTASKFKTYDEVAAFVASEEYKEIAKRLAPCRLWCCVELFETIRRRKGLVFRGAAVGEVDQARRCVTVRGWSGAEKQRMINMLVNCSFIVDVAKAECGNPADRAREMAKKSMRAAAAAGAEVPEDIKAWAAKIAAEARATRGA